jgi:hypothetical protein
MFIFCLGLQSRVLVGLSMKKICGLFKRKQAKVICEVNSKRIFCSRDHCGDGDGWMNNMPIFLLEQKDKG